MAAPLLLKLLPVAVLAAIALSGDGDGGGDKRKPAKDPIKVPGNDVPWDDYDEAICHCWEAGEHDSVALVNCALSRIHPEIDWPAQPTDHVTVMRTWQAVGNRVAGFAEKQARFAAGQGPDPCAPGGPPPPPPPPPAGPKATPAEVAALFRDAPESFVSITQHHNSNPSDSVVNAYKVPANSANVGRIVVARAMVGYNLAYYSRRSGISAATFGAARITGGKGQAHYYTIGPAWLAMNDRMLDKVTLGEAFKRKIGWGGTTVVGGSQRVFGAPWNPPINYTPQGIAVPVTTDPWDPRINPPDSVLRAMGTTLQALKASWLAGNP